MIESNREIANKFDQVDDFNWLKAEHSPNWRVLRLEERTTESVCKDIIPGRADINVDDILNATRVTR